MTNDKPRPMSELRHCESVLLWHRERGWVVGSQHDNLSSSPRDYPRYEICECGQGEWKTQVDEYHGWLSLPAPLFQPVEDSQPAVVLGRDDHGEDLEQWFHKSRLRNGVKYILVPEDKFNTMKAGATNG